MDFDRDSLATTCPSLVALPSLSPAASELLRGTFEHHGHTPTEDQWTALAALLDTFDAIVMGRDPTPSLYVSALDPGVGKTSALLAYLTALLRSPQHSGVGVLVCLSRLTEIKRLAGELKAVGGTIAIRTSDQALDDLSTVADPGQAQVLIITQQRLELIGAGKSLGEIGSLQYQGEVRALRVWDEAFIPSKLVALSATDIAAQFRWLQSQDQEYQRWAEEVWSMAKQGEDRAVVEVPGTDFFDEKLSLGDAIGALTKASANKGRDQLADRDKEALKDLWSLAGRAATVRKNGAKSPALVSFKPTLPKDLLPLVVLDASARVRKTYDLMEQSMPMVRLPTATKDYSALTIHVWDKGGGKGSMARKEHASEIIDVLADLVERSEPGRQWLVVSHKAGSGVEDMEKTLARRLGPTVSNVGHLTWGSHAATNDHADADRVFLAGTLFRPASYHEALARACVMQDPDDKVIDLEEIEELERGEHADLVLQGLCRAGIRRGSQGGSTACEAYLVATKKSGIKALLATIFPGCTIKTWKPVAPKLPLQPRKTLRYLTTWAATAEVGGTIRFVEVYQDLGINQDVFRKQVRGHEGLIQALSKLGIQEDRSGIKVTKYIKVE